MKTINKNDLFPIGIGTWGVASVILHFAYPDDYMILDFRAVWSLGIRQPK